MCPTVIQKTFGGTIMGPQWYWLGTRTILCYFLTNHNLSAPTFTELMLLSDQDNDVTCVCAK